MRNTWHFNCKLSSVIKAVCGSFGIVLITL
ncbi:DUF3265 domain-containing protein [Vibrio diabolicus]|nr:DUF3265 domain-containing protein [Vibrio diabolicus]MCR9494821.1 DUF3265 domain-containing protein [Vibrio alginolyticus]MCS0203107.1 DUF3265 domain-containing protein [Vibrio sp. HS-50-1]MCE9832798.1 DUF3265 domain-containing protein [Vibrio diabolicus]MCS0395263.1 DUF3265 domain-containing protein [Vibrio diabolicus]PLX61478.1 MAG: DUF3265 domain-containing protein [Vibrio alginolyticus]